MRTILLLTVLAVAGCQKPQLTPKKLSIARLEYKDKTTVVYLANDYGFLIQWLDNQPPMLFVYNKPANSIQVTSDFNVFLKHLKALPSGVLLDRKRGCSITALGMSKKQKSQLKQVIKEKKFILTDINKGNYPICTCETSKVTWFTTANQPLQQDTPDYSKNNQRQRVE
jgi:hypothetical protein